MDRIPADSQAPQPDVGHNRRVSLVLGQQDNNFDGH